MMLRLFYIFIFAIFATGVSIYFSSCEKDSAINSDYSKLIEYRGQTSPITIDEAKARFKVISKEQFETNNSFSLNNNWILSKFQPVWNKAIYNEGIINVPVIIPPNIKLEQDEGIKMLCFKNSNDEITFSLLYFINIRKEEFESHNIRVPNDIGNVKAGVLINKEGLIINKLYIFHNNKYLGHFNINNFDISSNQLEFRDDSTSVFYTFGEDSNDPNPCDELFFGPKWRKKLIKWLWKHFGLFKECFEGRDRTDNSDDNSSSNSSDDSDDDSGDDSGDDNGNNSDNNSDNNNNSTNLSKGREKQDVNENEIGYILDCFDFIGTRSGGGMSDKTNKCNPFNNPNIQNVINNCANYFDNDVFELGLKALLDDPESANEIPAGIILYKYGSNWRNAISSALYLYLIDDSINSITEALIILDQNPNQYLRSDYFYNIPKTKFAEKLENCLNVNFDIMINEYTKDPCNTETASTDDDVFEADCDNIMTLGQFIENLNNCSSIIDYIDCFNAINDFENKYNIELSISIKEKLIIKNDIDCNNEEEFNNQAKLLFLNEKLSLDDKETQWLKDNQNILNKIFDFEINNRYPDLNFSKVIKSLSLNNDLGLNDFTDNYGIWSDLNNPPSYIKKPDEIENGITIISTETVSPLIISNIFAQSPPRGNTEDLLSEIDADDSGIALNPNLSDAVYFIDMNILFNMTTALDDEMEDIADGFVQQFKDNIGGVRNDPLLDAKIKDHPFMRNYIKRFGAELNRELRETNGNIYSISTPIVLDQRLRPQFNSEWDRFHGYQILINDTEQTDIVLDSYVFNDETNEWTATFKFIIYDHFGLDKHDALVYQSYLFTDGFAAWWRLQHTRGYKPFITKIWIRATIRGNINN